MVMHKKATSNTSLGCKKRHDISNASRALLCSNNFDSLLNASGKDGNIVAPTLHISNPKDNMPLKSNPAIKPLMATLSTSAYEVPFQYLESFGHYQGESGQILLSTGNGDDDSV
ncbi:hypothetical protein R3W88_012008 [Solanum pinnatisectum]|uniref:Uncharacterized protein n=1 Tax=Solanum pinnatisectum TaxID=50273 RepID=A0AAV9LBE4_9SOLN|nr:hypothetical protein R3W88_012008 [Solanum pinnatisectum]